MTKPNTRRAESGADGLARSHQPKHLAKANHLRDNRGLLAEAEKVTLIWLAKRLPAAIQPDHLTALGLASLVGCGIAFAWSRWEIHALLAVIPLLALNWFGDSLDGTLARVRAHERPRYGFYLDHVVDLVGTLALCVGLGLSPLMHPFSATMLLVAYLMVTAETYLATHSVGTFRMAFLKVGPTELRILLALGVMVAWVDPTLQLFGHRMQLFDLGAMVGSLGLALTFAVSTIRNSRELARVEPAASSVSSVSPVSRRQQVIRVPAIESRQVQ